MSLETRSSSALFKRAEQLRRWEESETAREPVNLNDRPKKIKFSAGCVFLAACKAGDRDEILRLLKKGADIDTHDVDGLSALHQACIDDNLELVEFLVENGADINKGDNEGWTPLHATASCGFLSIARYLIEKGANVAAVNNDGELPVDVAESNEMEDLLQKELDDLGVDPEAARNEEKRLMLADAKNWLSSGYLAEKPHPKTGATALHVASAKGYLRVMDILIKAGADVNAQDLDGWTPLHAAAHWGQKEAAEILTEAHADMDIRNYVGQTAFDVAENEIVKFLEDLKKKQSTLPKENNDRRARINKKSSPQKAVISDGLRGSRKEKEEDEKKEEEEAEDEQRTQPLVTTGGRRRSSELPLVELEIHSPSKDKAPSSPPSSNIHDNQTTVESDDEDDDEEVSESSESSGSSESSDVSGKDEPAGSEKKNRANKDDSLRLPVTAEANKTVPTLQSPTKQNETEDAASWRRPGSFRSRLQDFVRPGLPLKVGGDKDSPPSSSPGSTVPTRLNPLRTETSQEVGLRRTQSFEADKTYRHFLELRARVQAGNSCPALHSSPMRSASLKERRLREESLRLGGGSAGVVPLPTGGHPSGGGGGPPPAASPPAAPASSAPASPAPPPSSSPLSTSPQATTPQVRSVPPSTPTTPGGSKLSPANIFKNFFKSFVPPVRDEESETQRKAHAKRVRETRRSTQGVTLEEIKSAEQLVKKKNQQILQQASQQLSNSEPTDEVVVKVHRDPQPPQDERSGGQSPLVATLTRGSHPLNSSAPLPTPVSATTTAPSPAALEERRPSWRLRVDNGSKFMLEDARKSDVGSKIGGGGQEGAASGGTSTGGGSEVVRRTAVVTPVTDTGDTTVTLPLRKPRSEDKDEKESSDSRNAQATQAAIQRRRRPKRRSTGVVHVDMDEIDPDRQSDTSGGTSPCGDGDNIPGNSLKSGSEISEPPSRLNSEPPSSPSDRSPTSDRSATENGEIDYKKLYEESQAENCRLREKLRRTEEELAQSKALSEKNAALVTRNSMSETEKRERRAMERKLSEMEEELKQLEQLKSENQRLKDENGALIRVISKLSK